MTTDERADAVRPSGKTETKSRHPALEAKSDEIARDLLDLWRYPEDAAVSLARAHSLLHLDDLKRLILQEFIKNKLFLKSNLPSISDAGVLSLMSPSEQTIIARARDRLLYLLGAGEMRALGRDRRDTSEFVEIPAEIWKELRPNFLISEARNSLFAYLDIRIARPVASGATSDSPKAANVPEARLRAWVEKKRPIWKADPTTFPGVDKAVAEARRDLGAFDRELLRNLLRSARPPQRARLGRPSKDKEPRAVN